MSQEVTTYAALCEALVKPEHNGPWGRAWQRTMGAQYDESWSRLEQARAVAWPEYTPPDALYLLASERGLERVPQETETQHRLRLKDAWGIWRRSASATGQLDAFAWTGLLNVSLHRRAEWSSPAPDPSAYVDAFARTVWAQFDMLISQPMPWTQNRWGDWTWGDGRVWGLNATPGEVDLLKRLGRTFKGGHETLTYLYFNTSNARVWGAWKWGAGLWGGGGDPPVRILVGETHWRSRFGIG